MGFVVIRSPLYFLTLLILAAGAYITYTLNLWGPILSMTNAASAQALEEFKKRLRELLENSETGRLAIAMSGGEEIAMRTLGTDGRRKTKGKGKNVAAESEEDEDLEE